MSWSDEEVEDRQIVWEAVSELWLDIELNDADLAYIAAILQGTKYSKMELQKIYQYEVAPAVFHNLLKKDGEPVAFNCDWLCERIIKKSTKKKFLHDLFFLKYIRSKQHTNLVEKNWKKILKLLKRS
jgi:transposase-like protein